MGYFGSQIISSWKMPLGEIPTTGRLVWEFRIPNGTDEHIPLREFACLS